MSTEPFFKPMDEEEALRLLEGHTCTLPELFRPVDELFDRLRCPECNGEVEKVVDSQRPFLDRDIVPNFLARCLVCGCTFTQEGIIVKTGKQPESVSNPFEGMSEVDPRNEFTAEQVIEEYLETTGLPRHRRVGSG